MEEQIKLRSSENRSEQGLIDSINIHNKCNKIVYQWQLTEKIDKE